MNKQLKNILSRFANKRIIVWGDFILDEYIYTTTGRISREAPVLVTEYQSNAFLLGGAGNVVLNIKALGAVPLPVGLVGRNSDGDELKKILTAHQVTTDYLISSDGYRTPKKSRILSGGENTKKQQVLRIDTLNKQPIPPTAYRDIESRLTELLETVDYMIISDYIYESVITPIYKRIRDRFPEKIVIIDSRNHLTKFKNITIATPNDPEIRNIFPGKNFYYDDEYMEAGRELQTKLNADGLIIKRGHKGMIIFRKEHPPEIIDIHGSADIVDVTGAGDTVISVLSLALAGGADLLNAAKLANIAAGYVVMKEGAYPIHTKELLNELN